MSVIDTITRAARVIGDIATIAKGLSDAITRQDARAVEDILGEELSSSMALAAGRVKTIEAIRARQGARAEE